MCRHVHALLPAEAHEGAAVEPGHVPPRGRAHVSGQGACAQPAAAHVRRVTPRQNMGPAPPGGEQNI